MRPRENHLKSDVSVSFISKLLSKDPYARPTIQEVLDQKLFQVIIPDIKSDTSIHDQLMALEKPFVPVTNGDDDISFFQAKNNAKNIHF